MPHHHQDPRRSRLPDQASRALDLFVLMMGSYVAIAFAGDDAQIAFQTSTAAGQPVLWRMQAKPGGILENLSARFDALAPPNLPGAHRGPISISPDGEWYVFKSERFDAGSQGWAGLTLARSDLTSVETIRAGGQTIHGEGLAQATAGATAVVYVDSGGPHVRDLFIVRRQGTAWQTPALLTAQSSFAWNYWPVLSPDGKRVAFSGGADSYPSTAIGEVNLDGTGFRVVITKDRGPPDAMPSSEVFSPAYALDSSLLFEAEWGGSEQVWRLPAAGGVPALVEAAAANDNSPAVLPDGRVVSLWLQSAAANGLHAIKVMDADGRNPVMLTSTNSPFLEVDDIGIGAGPLWAPVLETRTEGRTVAVFWPARFTHYTLQASMTLGTASWTNLTSATNGVSFAATNRQMFRMILVP